MLDLGLIVYCGLLVLSAWRRVCSYWCFGVWLSILNYMSLLYAALSAALVYLLICFYDAAADPVDVFDTPEARDLWSVTWLKPFVLVAPIAVCVTLALGWLLTESHLFEIHKRLAMIKHDRAVQIIALPAVFGVMALASMLPILELATGRIRPESVASPWYDFKHPLLTIAPSAGIAGVAGASASAAAPSLLADEGTGVARRRLLEMGAALLRAVRSTQQQHGVQFLALGRDPNGTEVPTVHGLAPYKDARSLAMWRYETSFYVADLFEAWILFHFGRLVLELVKDSITNRQAATAGDEEAFVAVTTSSAQESPLTSAGAVGGGAEAAGGGVDAAESSMPKAGRDSDDTHRAVAYLTWVGASILIAVCVLQSLCSFWPYLGGSRGEQDSITFHLQVAGLVASLGAIYNLVVVQKAFRRHLTPLWSTSKFLTMAFLLTWPFIQRGLLEMTQVANRMLPTTMQKIVTYVPILGDIIAFSDLQLHLFLPSLIIFECLVLSIAHLFVWRSNESWYTEPSTSERAPLFTKASEPIQESGKPYRRC